MGRRRLVAGIVLLVALSGFSVGAADYGVSVPGSIDTPSKTVSIEGDTYTVSSIARVSHGQSLTVHSSAPANEEYRVYVHGVDEGTRHVQDTKFVGANDSGLVAFDTSQWEPGSYVVSVYDSDTGNYYAPHPVVIPAVDTSLTVPAEATAGTSFQASVQVRRLASSPDIKHVELVFSHDGTTQRVPANITGDAATASVSLPNTGEYRVYALVVSTEPAPQGQNEVIGISDPTTLQVSETQSTTTTTSSSGGNGDENNETSTTTTTTSTTTTTTPTTTTGTTPTKSTSTSGGTTDPTGSTSTTRTPATSPASTTPRTSSALQPNDPTATSSTGSVGQWPPALVAVLALIGLLVRQHD